MENKKIQYILMFSTSFPGYHPRKGELTHFPHSLLSGTKHNTIRNNYAYWEKRLKKVNAGTAELICCYWSGLPRRSPLVRFMKISKVRYYELEIKTNPFSLHASFMPAGIIPTTDLARWEGFKSTEDFAAWFTTPAPQAISIGWNKQHTEAIHV